MPLPTEVQRVIRDALQAMTEHPQHALQPIYRQNIYNTLLLSTDYSDEAVRGRLSLLTAQHVLPRWQEVWPNDPTIEVILQTVDKVLRGQIDKAEAYEQAGEAWKYLETIVESLDDLNSQYDAWFAGQAAVTALFEVLGRDRFSGVQIDHSDTDEDLDLWTIDSAGLAATAYAGYSGGPWSDTTKRYVFWEWWLKQALPTAWEKAIS